MRNKKTYSVISHTHWDREWYLTFEEFRIRLVDLMDNLLAVFESDPKYRFHLDAQTIVIDDYLEIRPENREKIEGYVREGRLLIGPWYVQNDFHLSSGEATVRNLLIGTRKAEELGKCTYVGYAADQFGIISQLPQILRGFGIHSFIFARGYSGEKNQFYWESPNGDRVLCEYLSGWYNNLQRLPSDCERSLSFIRKKAAQCLEGAYGESALLMNGVDHLEAQEDLSKIIEGIRPMLCDGEELIQDTMPEYMDRLLAETEKNGIRLPVHEGELRMGGQSTLLTGTLSARVHLKQRNALLQASLERSFEPSYTALALLGIKEYPLGYSRYLWRTLIENHAHDSICGCSVDFVHRHMEDRFQRIGENLSELTKRAREEYLCHVDRRGISENAILLMCENNSPETFDGVYTAEIDILSAEDTGGFAITDKKGKNIPFEVVSIVKDYRTRVLSPVNLPGEKTVNRYTVQLRCKVEGLSRKVLICTPCNEPLEIAKNKRTRLRTMENEYLSVKVNSNGTVDIYHKESGRRLKNVLYFEDNADRGTVYNYANGTQAEKVNTLESKAKIKVVRDTRLEKSVSVETKLRIDRDCGSGEIPIEVIYTLRAGARSLSVQVNLDNTVNYHRLRVMLPTDIESDKSYAGQPFCIVERDKISPYEDDETHPNTDFVGIEDSLGGVAILNGGLYEYEHVTDERSTLALTLLRSVGSITHHYQYSHLSAESWRVPEAQVIGKHSFSLAIYPYCGDRVTAGVACTAQRHITPPVAVSQYCDRKKLVGGRPFVQSSDVPDLFYRPVEKEEIVIPLEKTFLKIDSDVRGAMVLSAFKGAEDKCGTVIRLYNVAKSDTAFSLTFGIALSEAYITDLNENIISPLKIEKGKRISTVAKKGDIVTIKVIPR